MSGCTRLVAVFSLIERYDAVEATTEYLAAPDYHPLDDIWVLHTYDCITKGDRDPLPVDPSIIGSAELLCMYHVQYM